MQVTPENTLFLMILIAVATPVIALFARIALGHAAREGIDEPPSVHPAKLWVLAFAGPVTLVLWLVFNRWLDFIGPRSVAGIIIATLVFVVAGFATGLFSRWFRRPRL